MTIKWANKGNELKSFNKNVCKINATNKMVHIMMYRKYSTLYNDSKSLLCTSKLMSNLIMYISIKLPMYNREHLHIVTFTYIFNIWYQTFELIFFLEFCEFNLLFYHLTPACMFFRTMSGRHNCNTHVHGSQISPAWGVFRIAGKQET